MASTAAMAMDQQQQQLSMSTSNVCVFCYESLLDGQMAVGVAVPCGHCFHQECWTAYVASKQQSNNTAHYEYQNDRRSTPIMKCPTCQGRVQTLGKLFLDFDCITDNGYGGGADDDMISLASDDDGKEQDAENENDSIDAKKNSDTVVGAAQQQPEVIVLDDADSGEEQQSQDKEKIRKYKKMAHKWKSKSEQTIAELEKVSEENDVLSEQVQDLSGSLASCTRKIQRYNERSENLNSEVSLLRRQVSKERQRADSLEASLTNNCAALDQAQAQLKKARTDTEKARTNYVVEAAELLKEHPVLAAKVKDLEYQNRVLRSQIQQQTSARGTSQSMQPPAKHMAKSDQRKFLRRVSNLREQHDVQQHQRNKQQPPERPQKKQPPSGMDVLESQPVLRTGFLQLGKKRSAAAATITDRKHQYIGAPKKKRVHSSVFR